MTDTQRMAESYHELEHRVERARHALEDAMARIRQTREVLRVAEDNLAAATDPYVRALERDAEARVAGNDHLATLLDQATTRREEAEARVGRQERVVEQVLQALHTALLLTVEKTPLLATSPLGGAVKQVAALFTGGRSGLSREATGRERGTTPSALSSHGSPSSLSHGTVSSA